MLFLDDAQHAEISRHSHATVGSKSSVWALSAPADLTCPEQPQVAPPPTAPAQERHLHPALSPLSFPEGRCRCTYLWSLPSRLDGPWTCTVVFPPALSLILSAAALDGTSWMDPRPGSPPCLVWGC